MSRSFALVRLQPLKSAPERLTPRRSHPLSVLPERLAPVRFALCRLLPSSRTPDRSEYERSDPSSEATVRLLPDICAIRINAPLRLARVRSVSFKNVPTRYAPISLAP